MRDKASSAQCLRDIAFGGNTDLGHQHRHQLAYDRGSRHDLSSLHPLPPTSCSSIGLEVPRGFRWQYRSLRLACYPTAAWPSDIRVVSSGSPDYRHPLVSGDNSGHRHQHRPQLGPRPFIDPDIAFGSSPGQYITLASLYLPVPHYHRVSSSTFLYRIQTPQVYLLFHPPHTLSFPSLHCTLIQWQALGCLSSGHCWLCIFLYRKIDV